eukprot:Tamp_12434.p5 GENE.Tamp_12434~~Tamp_12434.p5  ORF type:complete len:103 (-),score=8.94 Tamp_12434:381-689(-)
MCTGVCTGVCTGMPRQARAACHHVVSVSMRVSAVLSVLRAISSPEIIATPSGPLLLSPSPEHSLLPVSLAPSPPGRLSGGYLAGVLLASILRGAMALQEIGF